MRQSPSKVHFGRAIFSTCPAIHGHDSYDKCDETHTFPGPPGGCICSIYMYKSHELCLEYDAERHVMILILLHSIILGLARLFYTVFNRHDVTQLLRLSVGIPALWDSLLYPPASRCSGRNPAVQLHMCAALLRYLSNALTHLPVQNSPCERGGHPQKS